MTATPLVAGPVNTSSAFGGAGALESVTDLCTSLKSGDWVASGMAGVGAALDIAATVSDPLGSLIGAGLGWLMEHLEPLKGWLNDLAGDAGAVLGFADTWSNVATAMGAAGDELNRVVRSDLEAMSGASITAYAAYTDKLADHIRVTGTSASAIGEALKTCATVVKVVHDLVRDTLAQLVGSIISWVAEAVFSVGLATPVIIGQVTTRVSSLATKVGKSVTDVLTSAKSLKNLLEALEGALGGVAKGIRAKLPGGTAHSPTLVPVVKRPRIAVPGKYSDLPVREVAAGEKGAWAKELYSPKPKTVYRVDDKHLFVTDSEGRVAHVESDVDYRAKPDADQHRNGYQQGIAGGKDRLEGDHGGHLIASSLGGPGEPINLVAMASKLNGNGAGTFGAMERQVRDLLKGDNPPDVRMSVDVEYPAGSTRPSKFFVQSKVGDNDPLVWRFKN